MAAEDCKLLPPSVNNGVDKLRAPRLVLSLEKDRETMSDDRENAAITGVSEQVMEVVATAQRVPRERVNIDTTFEELGMDSLDGINLVFAVEEKFDIAIPDDAAKSIRTIREMVDGVTKLVTQKSA
jgi:acyl carrier protein